MGHSVMLASFKAPEGKDVWELELHESTHYGTGHSSSDFRVTRVPGGWIYRWEGRNLKTGSSVFVPHKEKNER